MTRAYAYVLSAVLLGATAEPLLRPLDDDGFPLSTYPMFSRHRPREVDVVSALAAEPDGAEHVVPPSYVANSEAMLALTTLKKSLAGGRKSARAMCEHVAAEIERHGEPEYASATEVRLVTSTVDSVRYLAGDTAPLRRKVHVRCRVPGRGEAKR